jgi:hypothetical protein
VTERLRTILLAIMLLLPAADLAWGLGGGFQVDTTAYAGPGAVAALFGIGSLFYATLRKDEKLSAMLFATCFLIVFSACASLTNYFLLTVAGSDIDHQLAALDKAMGVDWPALIRFAERHPLLNSAFFVAYNSMLPQIAALAVCLGLSGRIESLYKFCLAVAVGAAIAIATWTIAPAIGAVAVYGIPSDGHAFLVTLGNGYAHDMAQLLHHGPGRISPYDARGLIGFPSYHAELAVFVMWHAWSLRWLRWPAIALDCLVLIATPIQGGHHVIDVIAGIGAAAIAIGLVDLAARLTRPRSETLAIAPKTADVTV